MSGVLYLGHCVGRAGGQPDGPERRQVGQVVAHEADLLRRQAKPFDQGTQGNGLLFVTLEHMRDLELGRTALDGIRAAAGEDRRLLAGPVP